MSFLNSIVDKVYVINLKKDKEKLDSITKEFEYQDIQVERFEAVDGNYVSNNKQLTEFCNKFCGNGIKGCAISHKTLWEKAITNNFKHIAIFEDDSILDKNFNTILQLNYYTIPSDFDIIYLGSLFYCDSSQTYNKLFNYKNIKINDTIIKVEGCAGLHGYIISQNCIQKIINEKVNFHIDSNLMDWIHKYNLKAYAFNPSIVKQNVDNSNLSNKYPYVLNSIIHNIPVTNDIKLDWLLNEVGYQYGFIKLCSLMLFVAIICFFIPLKYYYLVYLWLLLEFLFSFHLVDTLVYTIIVSAVFFIKN